MDAAEQNDKDLDRIRQACGGLIEHFDSVQIFATRHEPEVGTVKFQLGRGNWYARYGQIREWLITEEQASRNSVRPEE